jgi:hypothetical protein
MRPADIAHARQHEQMLAESYAEAIARGAKPYGSHHLHCQDCRREFFAAHRTARRCIDCRVAKDRTRHHVKSDARQCQSCGESFIPKRADAVYCSPACRQRCHRQRAGKMIAKSVKFTDSKRHPSSIETESAKRQPVMRKYFNRYGKVSTMNVANIGKRVTDASL